MPVRLAPSARQQFLDSAGNPYVGAKLFTYIAGTTTKQATYTTSVGNVANTNPLILDASGRTPSGLWLTEGADYKFVLAPAYDTDPPTSAIYTEDGIEGVNDAAATSTNLAAKVATADLAASTGSGLVGHISAGVGAVARTARAKLRETVSVADFGAVGDGVANDVASIASANTAGASGGVVYPPGVYYIDTNTTLTSPITMMPGARFKVNTGRVLTINAPVYAGSRQYIFEGASASVVGTLGNVDVWVDWFGAVPDGNMTTGAGTDSGPPTNKAIVCAANSGTKFGTVRFNPGNYLIDTAVVNSYAGMNFIGAGKYVTILTTKNAFIGAAITLGGPGGPPTSLSGFGVVAQYLGSFGANGISLTGNGVFVSDVWVNGYNVGVKMSSTDQHLTDFIAEQCYSGVGIFSTSFITVANGTVHFNQNDGIYGENGAATLGGSVVIANVRSTADYEYGFRFVNVDNLSITGCTVSHNNGGQYTIAAYSIEGSSKNVLIDGCLAYVATPSVSAVGFKLSCVQVALSNSEARNFYVGVKVDQPYNYSIIGCTMLDSVLHGIHATSYNFLTIANNHCHYSGTAGAADSGITIAAGVANQRLLINGNQCNSTGGGVQDYGIHVTCTSATSHGTVNGNVSAFNNVSNITIDGANAANIVAANNITV